MQPGAQDRRASLAANVAEFAAAAAARGADPRYSEHERAADDAMLKNARVVVTSLFADGAEEEVDAECELDAVPDADAGATYGVDARDHGLPSCPNEQQHHAAPDGCAPFDGDGTADPAVVLDRAAARDRAADAAEWEERAAELARQREAARRERVRRRNMATRAAELAQRQIRRVSELRASAAAAASAAWQEEHQRARARASLHLRTQHCMSLGSLLVALQVTPAGWPLSGPREITAAYRLAALRFHPDRGRSRNAEEAAFAEEAFKLIAKMKQEADF
jgi:murein DD-endopeptidase MepM/ murein hydrolase activator NlpD